jgi:nicotinamidase-related amidase
MNSPAVFLLFFLGGKNNRPILLLKRALTFFHARYAEGILKTKNVDSTRSAISSLLEKYRAAGDGKNIVHVVQAMPEGTPIFTPDTHLAAEFDEITPKPGEKVIAKEQAGSFAGTDLDEYLGSLGEKG